MIFNNSKSALIFLSITVLVLALGTAFAVHRIYSENKESSELLNEASEIEKNEILSQSLRTIENSNREDFEALDKITLTDEDLVSLIETIEDAGSALRLKTSIGSVDKVGEGSEGEHQKIRISVESSGSWTGNFSFLKAIENLPYRVMFESVSFDKLEGAWESNIVFSLYSFK